MADSYPDCQRYIPNINVEAPLTPFTCHLNRAVYFLHMLGLRLQAVAQGSKIHQKQIPEMIWAHLERHKWCFLAMNAHFCPVCTLRNLDCSRIIKDTRSLIFRP